MPLESPFRLRSVSVVVTAQSHNPSILTHEFLVNSGVVPSDWVAIETVGIPPFSLIRFQNGVQWTLDESRLIVAESCESSFQDSYQVHTSVTEYLRKVDYVPYRSLGLNWAVYLDTDAPSEWLIKRFLKDGPWTHGKHELVSMKPRFTFDNDGVALNLAFGDQAVTQGGLEKKIFVDCNVHHEGPLNATQLRDAIDQWEKHQSVIVDTLNLLSEGEPV